jgi:hypothetical protein
MRKSKVGNTKVIICHGGKTINIVWIYLFIVCEKKGTRPKPKTKNPKNCKTKSG